MTEEWCPVVGFPDYMISDQGRGPFEKGGTTA